LDHRSRIARAIIPIAIAITVVSITAPSLPVAATEPAPTEPATSPIPAAPATTVVAPATTSTSGASSRRHRVSRARRLIRVARRQLGDRYVYGASGPRRFDCSGLVLYSLRHSHNRRIAHRGGRSADSIYAAYRRQHRVGRRHGHPGDFVIWGGGRHIGIYLGHGRAISALTRRGVSVHGLHAVTMPFTGFLHTRLWRRHR
jgi:cell wall-associated NlpC family hydrolase